MQYDLPRSDPQPRSHPQPRLDPPPRRLSRSSREKMVAGVAGGMGEYFDVDPTIVRLVWVAAAILTSGLAIPVYVVLWLIMPQDDQVRSAPAPRPASAGYPSTASGVSTAGIGGGTAVSDDPALRPIEPPAYAATEQSAVERTERRQRAAGFVLVALGLLFLAGQVGWFRWIDFRYVWPIILIAIGIGLLMRQGNWRRS